MSEWRAKTAQTSYNVSTSHFSPLCKQKHSYTTMVKVYLEISYSRFWLSKTQSDYYHTDVNYAIQNFTDEQ